MKTATIIKKLKNSNLYAECPCGGEFKLSNAILFDGTKPFPLDVLEIKTRYEVGLKQREYELKKRKKLATEKALITTKAVNIGKNLEKILPTIKDFKWDIPDCRFLDNPIDLITFNGFSNNKIQSISFIEIKSGNARLNAHQRCVRDAIHDKKVSFKVFK